MCLWLCLWLCKPKHKGCCLLTCVGSGFIGMLFSSLLSCTGSAWIAGTTCSATEQQVSSWPPWPAVVPVTLSSPATSSFNLLVRTSLSHQMKSLCHSAVIYEIKWMYEGFLGLIHSWGEVRNLKVLCFSYWFDWSSLNLWVIYFS